MKSLHLYHKHNQLTMNASTSRGSSSVAPTSHIASSADVSLQSTTVVAPPESKIQQQPTIVAKPVTIDNDEASKKCNKWVETGITNNKSIKFLLQTLIDSGCTPPEHFIRCTQCVKPQAGGFGMVVEEQVDDDSTATTPTKLVPIMKDQCQRTLQEIEDQIKREQQGSTKLSIQPEIYVCQQYMENEHMVHKTVHHELIHAIDMCRTKMDPLHNCIHLACTEIRAENLSGECSFFKEIPRMSSFRKHGQECVRRRAILSVKANPNCTARAEEYVDAALPRCFQDNYPYDRHPNQR